MKMRLKQQVRDFRKTLGGVVNLAFIPVRFPGVAVCFLWCTISHWWSERRERKHGRVLDVGSVMGDPWLPNGQYH